MGTPGTAVPEEHIPVLGFEGSVAVTVPMHGRRIGTLLLRGFRLLEGLCAHHLVEGPGDETFHTALVDVHLQW
jgi:hypothetical protein